MEVLLHVIMEVIVHLSSCRSLFKLIYSVQITSFKAQYRFDTEIIFPLKPIGALLAVYE